MSQPTVEIAPKVIPFSTRRQRGMCEPFDSLGRRSRGTIEPPILTGAEFYSLPLNRGEFSLLDPEDFIKHGQFRWSAHWDRCTKNYYAVRTAKINGKKVEYKLSREVLGLSFGDPRVADHINHNTLDNRKSNLRAITQKQNTHNRKTHSNNKSGLRGLRQIKSGKWEARIMISGQSIGLGYFALKDDAIKARREAELKYFGEFAYVEVA